MRRRALLGVLGICALAACDIVFSVDRVHPNDAAADSPVDAAPGRGWKQVTTGLGHTCAIREDDTLWCWGLNDLGELGVGSYSTVETSTQVGTAKWLSVATSYEHTCGIQVDHSGWCWGGNDSGQLGIGNTTSSPVPVQLTGTVQQFALGYLHTCAIDLAGSLWCWGRNSNSELGDGGITNAIIPEKIGTDTWELVSAGTYHSCAIKKSDHTLWCWGHNGYGEYGDGSSSPSAVPKQVGTEQWSEIDAAFDTTCGRTLDGRLRCAGSSNRGQVGAGIVTNAATPTYQAVTIDSADFDDWVNVSSTDEFACAVRSVGALFCWGNDNHGQLGSEQPDAMASRPVRIEGGWTSVSAATDHACAIDAGSALWCWGSDAFGELGDNNVSMLSPHKLAGTWSPTVAAGAFDTCALDTAMTPSCTGDNAYGQLGDATYIARQDMAPVPNATLWSALATGSYHTCALKSSNAYCWGYNGNGQLGDGTTTSQATPKQVNGTWNEIGVGEGHTCGRSSGTVYCWGYNAYAQIGNNSLNNSSVPVMLSLSNIVQLVVGYEHTCALNGGGNALCWGRGYEGQLGNNSASLNMTPDFVDQTTSGPFEAIYTGAYSMCARTVDHKLWCWGYGYSGALGVGDIYTRYVPTQVSSTALWAQIAVGEYHACGVQTNGTLWCWGSNNRGQLGLGSHVTKLLPTRVGTDSDWTNVYTGTTHTCARKTDASLWCWGWNVDGQLGDGMSWRSPVMVP